jgi:predicted TIM-barrel fold metal-dependent hydrolase
VTAVAAADAAPGLPEGGCDCHVHLIGPQSQYPMTPERRYTPGPAPFADLRAHLASLGLQRAVLVQPSVYGTDNRCMLEGLSLLDGAGRGVAVPPGDASASELRELHARGVRGVRINLESSGDNDPQTARSHLSSWSGRVADLGWHVQLYAAPRLIDTLADDLVIQPTAIVLDHFAMVSSAPDDPSAPGSRLPDLLRTGRVHVKLSAPYRLTSPRVAVDWAAKLLEAAPLGVVWGSDWPHTARAAGKAAHEVSPYHAITQRDLADGLVAWLPTPVMMRQVLVDNPARLYDF